MGWLFGSKPVASTHHRTERHGKKVSERIPTVDHGKSRVTGNGNVIRKSGGFSASDRRRGR